MTPSEAVMLTEYVRQACPQQARTMGEYTPDAWFDLLEDLDFADCKAATVAVARRQPFVAPAEIRAEVRRARAERLARTPLPAPPAELADSPGRYKAAIQMGVRRIAAGFDPHRAIEGGPLDGDPPAEWAQARAALEQPPPDVPSPQEVAAEQAAKSRAERDGRQGPS